MNQFCQKIAMGYQPDLTEVIEQLGDIFPLLRELVYTPQDPEWHAEGNVFIHTRMVLSELYGLINAQKPKFSPDQLLALVLGTALHDIAKPITTRNMEIRGVKRVAAPRHEYKGGSYIAYRLLELNLPYHVIHQIISLVIYHIKPKLLVVKNAPISEYRKLARMVNIELLYYLEKADMLGRICKDQKEQVENIEMFKKFCQEYNLWPNQKPYKEWEEIIDKELFAFDTQRKAFVMASTIKDAEEGLISTPEEGIARSYSYREHFSELIILCGPSGAGKSTWIAKNLTDYEVVSLDQLRIEIAGNQSDQSKNEQVLQAAKKALKIHLAKKSSVGCDQFEKRLSNSDCVIRFCLQSFGYHCSSI